MSAKTIAKTRVLSDEELKTRLPCIVGIGASAGGYEAIRSFFQVMPADSGVAFIIIQHLAADHPSLAAELFARYTQMPVMEASDGLQVLANHVYTSPSDKEINLINGYLCLTPRSEHQQIHLPIDHFFDSLAQDCGARAIGIVFSGGGTDGALGLKSISAHDGIVLVQEPATAEFDGMPRSAIATGVVNYVLPLEQMPAVISGYAHHPYAANDDKSLVPDTNSKTTQSIIKIIHTKRGYDFSGYKRSTLLRRIHRRMGLHSILKQTDYLKMLSKEPKEVDALFRDLLIGVTEFFRDPEAWKTLLRDAITPIVATKLRDEPIRIWIPGCSTGEEAYTMAMVVIDKVRQAKKNCPVQIFATDTNNDALEIGRLGRYPIGIAARISPLRLKRYFSASADREHFLVSDELRAAVVFGTQNMFADPPFGRVDLISCRNVLIYLEPDVQKKVLNIFHFALRKDAYLFLGSAESNGGRDDLFRPCSKRWRIFQREGITPTNTLSLPPRIGDTQIGTTPLPSRNTPQLSQVASITQKLLLDRFSPASVLVNSRYEVLYFCGETDEFLARPRGAPTQDLLAMVREGLRSRVRSALDDAASSHLTVDVFGARMKSGNAFAPVHITITPSFSSELGKLYLVVFRHDLQPSLIPIDKSTQGALVRHLEEELQATRDDLQGTIERYESAVENLKISTEEVVTTNEELRSLNEELESSKEELQSLNEELTTVNQQLETKLREIEVANSDLHNLLTSSDIATVCLDQALRIKWFAPATQRQFNFIASDIGRPISDLSSGMGDSELIAAAHSVLMKKPMADFEFQVENGRWYIRRVLPYTTDSAQIHGVIVTYTDITDIRLAIEANNATRRDLDETVEKTEQMRALSTALALAEERERRSLAKYLHDDLGQIFAVISLKAVAVHKQKMSAPLRLAVEDCTAAIAKANDKLREMAFQLNPPMLDQLEFATALQWLTDEVHRVYALDISIEDDGKPKQLEPAMSATVFRAVRELLTNVSKHAKIEKATIHLIRNDDNTMSLSVNDAGAGFAHDHATGLEARAQLGLISMRERLDLMGGKVAIHSNPGDGTSVVLTVPLISNQAAPDPRQKNKSANKQGIAR